MHSVAEKPVPASYASRLPLDGPNLTPPCNEIQPAGPIRMGERSNVVDVHLNLDIDDGYKPFMNDLVKELTHHPQHTANKDEYDWITDKNPLLPEQMAEEPARWIYVHLTAKDNNNETKKTILAIRDDPVYLVGFWSEKAQKWYELGTTGKNAPFITGSAFLGCDVTYVSLLGENGKNDLVHVNVGMGCASDAVCKLSSYDREGVVDPKTKKHLACLIVMICESARMFPLLDTVQNCWLCRQTAIDEEQIKYVDNWVKLSKAAMGWGKFPKVLEEFGVVDRVSALRVVRLLLNSPSKGSGGGGGRGRVRGRGGGDGGGRGRKNEEHKQPQQEKGKQMQQQEDEPSTKPGGGGGGRNKRSHDDPNQKQQDEEEPPLTPSEQGPSQQQDEQEPPPMPAGQSPPQPQPQPGLFYEEEEDDADDGGEEEDDDDDSNDDGDDDDSNDDGDDDCAAPGQFLLEVLAVHADIRVVGTIAVFDGKRGQIIYSDDGQGDAPNKDSQDNLLLTGPYKAISAGGRVSVKFTDQSSNVGRATLWDAYNDSDGDTYDTVLTKYITLGGITMTYAVLSNAVEAHVQVEMKLNGSTTAGVHGEIMARVPRLGGKSVLLFCRRREQALEALTSSDGLIIPVPLPRSVLVVPFGIEVMLELKLHAARPSTHENIVAINKCVLLSLNERPREIESQGMVVQVKITSPDFDTPSEEDDETPPPETPTTGSHPAPAAATTAHQSLHKMAGHEGKDGPPVMLVPLTLDLDNGDYARCIQDLREKLTDHRNHGPHITVFSDWIKHRLLPMQQPKQPARWIHIKLMARSETNEKPRHTITLLIRDDNVYLVGFINKNGDWFELGVEGRNEHLIRGSTFLGCDVGYTGLVGGSQNLEGLEVGKSSATQAVRRLSEYKHAGPADAATRQDLALLCVMFCEAARMIPHYDTVNDGWNVGSKINVQHVEYTRTWENMSWNLFQAVQVTDKHPVHLLLNSQRELPSMLGRGRPLVEVSSVRAEDGVVGTITVFDGKRGQIIYKHGDGYLPRHTLTKLLYRDKRKLALSGPSKAISADGSFAIQVDGIIHKTDASEESSKVSGDMFWDCYAGAPAYDSDLTHEIITSTGRIVEVAYVVYSNAVEATVQVNLLLPAGINHVYGQITARVPLPWTKIVLFSREPEEKVELVPSSAGSTFPLQLARSVIVVPLRGFWQKISVDLHVASANNESDKINLTGHTYFKFDEHKGTIYSDYYGDIFLPVDGTHPYPAKGIGEHPEQGTASYSSHLQDTHAVTTSSSLQGTKQTSVQKGMVQVNITSRGFQQYVPPPSRYLRMFGSYVARGRATPH